MSRSERSNSLWTQQLPKFLAAVLTHAGCATPRLIALSVKRVHPPVSLPSAQTLFPRHAPLLSKCINYSKEFSLRKTEMWLECSQHQAPRPPSRPKMFLSNRPSRKIAFLGHSLSNKRTRPPLFTGFVVCTIEGRWRDIRVCGGERDIYCDGRVPYVSGVDCVLVLCVYLRVHARLCVRIYIYTHVHVWMMGWLDPDADY